MKSAMLIALCVLLTACGGGGDEEEPRKSDPLNCQAHPEKCK